VEKEITRLKQSWRLSGDNDFEQILLAIISQEKLAHIDPFQRPGLAYVIEICRTSKTLSQTGRKLYAVSRLERKTTNDADRLKNSWQNSA